MTLRNNNYRKTKKKYATNARNRRKVNALVKEARQKREMLYYSLGYIDESTGSSGSPRVIPLCDFTSLTPRFGTEADDSNDASAILKSINMHTRVTLENISGVNEEETTTFTVFLVSVKDEASNVINATTGFLNPMTDGSEFYIVAGMVYLNNKVFKVHKFKRFTLTNHGTLLTAPSAQSQYGTALEWSWKIKPNVKITAPGFGGVNDWIQMKHGDPSSSYYLLFFSDNSGADLENPTFTSNIIEKFERV